MVKNIETSIENTRKFIGKLTTAIACKKKSNTYSKNQKRLKDMFEKQFGNTKLRTLQYKLELYEQKLKASCTKLKYQKVLHQRKVINRQFSNNPRQVFLQMKEIALKVEVLLSKNDVEQFWSDIWKDYSIRADTFKKAIQKLRLKKPAGPDLITGLWYKKLSFLIPFMANYFYVLLTTWKQSQIGQPKRKQCFYLKTNEAKKLKVTDP